MIHLRNAFSIERRRVARVDMDGHGLTYGTIGPVIPGHEYITFVLGDAPRGERVSMEDVLEALRHHIVNLERALAEPVEDQ